MIDFITSVAGQFTQQYLIVIGVTSLCGIVIGFAYHAVVNVP